MKKVELLAPAGNFRGLKGAVKAGADAVYLGGGLYGARAYADNFTQDEICEGIRFAHIFGRKIYLTVNTLIKERELDCLYDFLLPLYESGLDGVIIQDLGVLRYLKRAFPKLALHASTQMTLTGSRGADLVKEEGICRIVPARELSLEEIKRLKRETGMEIETFIHGAMCYCYSGQCLFSSILGGRSGNRGRCAQPCRLPYKVNGGKQCYPLSMKDMCTIRLLPKLIEAGIDSFKIEGRMKKPAYAAGVTAIYRKYIDLYYRDRKNYHVSQKDMDILNDLYIRSEIGEGYYMRHNGKEMLSLHSPSYSETDAVLLADIEKQYIEEDFCLQADADICLVPGQEAVLTIETNGIKVSCKGDRVQKAVKQPLAAEKIAGQVKKSGNSPIKINQVNVVLEDEVFLPVHALNELRRKTLKCMEDEIIRANGLDYADRRAVPKQIYPVSLSLDVSSKNPKERQRALHALVRTAGQLEAACKACIPRIYLDASLPLGEIFREIRSVGDDVKAVGTTFYLAAPYIVREKDINYLEKMEEAFETGLFQGILVRNLESYQYFCQRKFSQNIVLDANLYIWNRESLNFWEGRAEEFYLPVECNRYEWDELLKAYPQRTIRASAVVYGRLPMMVTSNCLKKTAGKCEKMPEMLLLKDRYEKIFPVYTDCTCCYNIIYNSVPLSLHRLFSDRDCQAENFRLDFTTEGKDEAAQIIRYFGEILKRYKDPFYKEFTTGHYKRGVE